MTSFSSKKPIFWLPRTFKSLVIIHSARIGHSADKANTGGGVFTLIHSDLAFSPVSVSSLFSQDPHSDYICVKVLFSNHSPLQLLNLYSPPIRSTPSVSRTRTFSSDILPNSPDTFIHGDFNAHHPTWDRLIPPIPPRNDLFCWISSSGLEILIDPAFPTLLHHSTGSRSSPDISLAPASLAPHCERRTLLDLALTFSPLKLSSLSLQFVTPTLIPPNSTTKRPVGMFTNHILLSTSPLLMLTQSASTRLPALFPSS